MVFLRSDLCLRTHIGTSFFWVLARILLNSFETSLRSFLFPESITKTIKSAKGRRGVTSSRNFSWPPKSKIRKFISFVGNVLRETPKVGAVLKTSPFVKILRMVVFPALDKPQNRITFDFSFPILGIVAIFSLIYKIYFDSDL